MEVLEVWTSHVIYRLADALYNFFGLRLTKEQTENEHPLDFVSRTLKEGDYFMDEDWMEEPWLGLDIWLRALGQACRPAPGPRAQWQQWCRRHPGTRASSACARHH